MKNKRKKMSVDIHECLKCGHEWVGTLKKIKSGIKPTYCASCKDPNWETKRREKREVKSGLVQDKG